MSGIHLSSSPPSHPPSASNVVCTVPSQQWLGPTRPMRIFIEACKRADTKWIRVPGLVAGPLEAEQTSQSCAAAERTEDDDQDEIHDAEKRETSCASIVRQSLQPVWLVSAPYGCSPQSVGTTREQRTRSPGVH